MRGSNFDGSVRFRQIPRGGFLKLVKAVFWSFFGVRRRADLENDAAQLKPLHLIAAGVIGAVVFIVVLLLVVRAVVG